MANRLLIILIILLLLPAFSSAQVATCPDRDRIETTGTIVYVSLEGGFYGIVSDNGQKYDPMNLPVDLKKTGLRIAITGCTRQDVSSFRMWGESIEILSVIPQQNQAK